MRKGNKEKDKKSLKDYPESGTEREERRKNCENNEPDIF